MWSEEFLVAPKYQEGDSWCVKQGEGTHLEVTCETHMWKKHERKMEYDDHLLDVNLEREDVSKEEKSLEGRELDISD